MSFPNENNHKTDPKCYHGWVMKKTFHFRSPKMALYLHAQMNHLCFCKNSSSRIFTFISRKLVYFKKYLAYQEFPLPLNVLYCCETIKLTV